MGVKDNEEEGQLAIDQFRIEVESLLFLNKNLFDDYRVRFKELHQSSLKSGAPIGTILVTERDECRLCDKRLVLETNFHVVVVYHSEHGTYLGSRLTKRCKSCRLLEHYGYYTLKGVRHMDESALRNEFLLSSEDTAFHLSLLKQCANLLIVGAVPFSTFTNSYNRRFGYCSKAQAEVNVQKGSKRMKRFVMHSVGTPYVDWGCK